MEAFKEGKVKGTGAMVHRVVAEVDQGEPVLVREIEIKEGEGLEELEERIHKVEHKIIVEGARKVLEEIREGEKEEKDVKGTEKEAVKEAETEKEPSKTAEKESI